MEEWNKNDWKLNINFFIITDEIEEYPVVKSLRKYIGLFQH
jgi:hypothetical protein